MKKFPVSLTLIQEAHQRIGKRLTPTLLTPSELLSERYQRSIFIKWENRRRTGSFKERGALNFLLQLSLAQRKQGVCAASAGNHALALSYYAASLKIPCTIVMPKTAPVVKVRFTESHKARVILHGNTFHEAMEFSQRLSKKEKLIFVHGFDDPKIIAGQGTAGIEILNQCPEVDGIIVPIGGGGLISGIGVAVKGLKPSVSILGVQSQWALDARAGKFDSAVTPLVPISIADGIAVKTRGINTEKIMSQVIDHHIVASEELLAHSVIELLEVEKTLIEGAGAASLCALHSKLPKKLKTLVLVVCGSNIDVSMVARLIAREMGDSGRLIRLRVSVPDRPGSLAKLASILADAGAQILQTNHDRALCRNPGNVLISFMIEVRDSDHHQRVLGELKKQKIELHQS